MAKLTITRPNGNTEYAELTTNKSLVGDNYLTVEKSGTTYYAKLASNISTHMYVIKPYSSTKLYVQKKADKKKYKIRIDQDYPNQQEVNVTINGHYYCYEGVEEFEEGTEWKAWVYNKDSNYENGHIVGDTSGILHSDIHVWASAPTKKSAPTPPPKPPTPFTWKYVIDDNHKIKDLVIPETGKYKLIINHAHKSFDGAILDDYDDIQTHKFSKYSSVTNYKITAIDGTIIQVYKNEPGVPKNGQPTYWDTVLKSIEYIGEA